MKPTITSSNYHWLTLPSLPTTKISAGEQTIARSPIPVPDDIGTAWFTSIQLPMNIVIRRAYHRFKPEATGRLLTLANCFEEYTEPVLFVQSVSMGRVVLKDNRIGTEFIVGGSDNLFRHIDKLDSQQKLDTSGVIDVIMFIIGDSVLNDLLGEDQAKRLLKALRVEAVLTAALIKVPHHISSILHNSMPDHLTGSIRTLFAQAKVLEYITALFTHFTEIKEETHPTSAREHMIRQLQADLKQLDGKVPGLDELGKRYGMSARVLNDEFKRMCGQSIYAYITETRLTEAHAALLGSDLPMKTLATNLGYCHVNHFINAFRKKFGYSPGSLRRKKRW